MPGFYLMLWHKPNSFNSHSWLYFSETIIKIVMYIQDPKLWLQHGQSFTPGDNLCISFKLPKIESKIFGNFEDLKGSVPLLLKHGDEVISQFFKLTFEEQNKIINYFKDFIKRTNEELSDEEVLNSAIFNLSGLSCYFAKLEPCSPEYIHTIKAAILMFQADDILDTPEIYEDIDFDNILYVFAQAISQAQSGNLDLFSKLHLKFPALEKALSLIVNDLLAKEKANPETLAKDYFWYFQSYLDIFISQILVYSPGKMEQFNEDSKVVIRGINKGIGVLLETQACQQGIVVGHGVRGSFPFIQMMNCFNRINSRLNDIRGLGRDVKNGQFSDNSILERVVSHENDTDLESEFYRVLLNLRNDYKMIQSYFCMLESSYGNECGLKSYIMLIKTILDGQCYGYFGFAYLDLRYGAGGDYKILKNYEAS